MWHLPQQTLERILIECKTPKLAVMPEKCLRPEVGSYQEQQS
jgi:hypothetical protein